MNTFAPGLDEDTFVDGYAAAVPRHRHLSHCPLSREKALSLGGLRFAPTYEEMRNEVCPGALSTEVHFQSRCFAFVSVGLQVLIGVVTGLAAWPVSFSINYLTEQRLSLVVRSIRNGEDFFFAWVVHFGIMVAFALLAALPVILFVPSAGSSGIPSVIGLLNGVDLRGDFTWRPLCARLVGIVFAVSSGLAVGPEGPMIFVGACIGAVLSKIPSSPAMWRSLGRVRTSLNEHVYLRDYISTGAACGIAAAFRAPIAGTLFVVEEAASHFSREHLAKMFMACVAAKLVVILCFNSTALFEYQVTTGDFCEAWQWLSVCSLLLYIFIGIVCGVAGAAFNWLNLWIVRFRTKFITPRPFRRAVEIIVLCMISSGMWVMLPMMISEQRSGDPGNFQHGTRCLKDDWRYQLVASLSYDLQKVRSVDRNYRIRYTPQSCLYGVQLNYSVCSQAYKHAGTNLYAKACTVDLFKHSTRTDRCCFFTDVPSLLNGSFMLPSNTYCSDIDFGPTFPSLQQQAKDRHGVYNPMASLTLVPFSDAAVNLFSRGTPFLFRADTLVIFFVVYFFLAAATSGCAVPAGLLLPMIIVGGVIGRLVAIGCIQLQWYFGFYSAASFEESIWTRSWQSFFYYEGGPLPASAPLSTKGWIDPGVAAMVGAAAMLGGVSRISLMLTVMMVEITGDPSLIGPMALATLVAVVVGNAINHGLYHSLIDIASYPFLPDKWPKVMPKALRLYHILPQDSSNLLAQIPLDIEVAELQRRLRSCDNIGFAVTSSRGAVVGLALRQNLSDLLKQVSESGPEPDQIVDIAKATDFHCITVRDSLPLEVAYNFFKSMEMEHVIVVDDENRPIFILTRSSLLPWRVEETIRENGFGSLQRCRAEIRRPRSWRIVDPPTAGPNAFDEESGGSASRGSLRQIEEDAQ